VQRSGGRVRRTSVLAIRKGQWKLVDAKQLVGKGTASSGDTGGVEFQLYDLSKDPRESRNVADANLDIVRELSTKLRGIRDEGRSVHS
jgi:hypothetical protein